jgi:hypothetical protein
MNQALTDMDPIYTGHGSVSSALATAAKHANNDLAAGGS